MNADFIDWTYVLALLGEFADGSRYPLNEDFTLSDTDAERGGGQ